jgi:hypothetical protein
VEQLEHRWCPSYSLVTSRAALAGTDSVNWGTLGGPATLASNPLTILSTAGQSITVSKPLPGDFETYEQAPSPAPPQVEIQGNFAPGDIVLATNNQIGKTNPIRLNFGTTPVTAGGAQVESSGYGAFTARIEAFDVKGKSLASFTEAGMATAASDSSAIFIGISSSSTSIYQIAISITKAPNNDDKAYVEINQFDFRTSPVAAVPATAAKTSIKDPIPLMSSSLNLGQPALPASPGLGLTEPPAFRSSATVVLPPVGTTAAVPVGAADAAFAASHPAAQDDAAWLFAPLVSNSLDAE